MKSDKPVSVDQLRLRTLVLRQRILRMIHQAGSGHPGGSLSVIDLLATTMLAWGRFSPHASPKDWLVLGKGHAAPAYYAVLCELGYLSEEELYTYRQAESRLQGHPDRTKLPAVQVTTGHLGQGLSIAAGIALGEKMNDRGVQVYAILGDGDLHEGQTWEAAMAASHYRLDNLVCLLDWNRLSQHGLVDKVMTVDPLEEKWRAFGWETKVIDGHDHGQILEGLRVASQSSQPFILLCRTIKGKGVSFMENDPLWHSRDLPLDLFEKAVKELEVS